MAARDLGSIPLRWSERLERLPPLALTVMIGAALGACWAIVYGTGGSGTAWPHVFYVPIVVASLPFGALGGVVAGLVAMILSGPLMPLDTVTGDAQEMANWLLRGAFFVAIGALSGATTAEGRNQVEDGLARRLLGELQVAAPSVRPVDAAWAATILRTLEAGAFHPVFQPLYRLADGRLFGVEALTRFDGDPPKPPNVWFERAHEAGLGIDLEIATLEVALEASAGLAPEIALSFNASPALLTDQRLYELLDRHEGRKLVAEVTEHAVIEDYRDVTAARANLRERGILVAVDDAGAGFASLRHIVMLQPDMIKLDTSLTQDLRDDPIRGPLADALLQFAERTGSQVVVEGIEAPSDLTTWRALGAHIAQGYLLARPGPLPFPVTYAPLKTVPSVAGRSRPTRAVG